jgi:hypothetical protein
LAASDGTAQPGSTLPIVYDEFGVESTIPNAKGDLYSGQEPATTHPVEEATQAGFYRQAFQLAFCQPHVRAILLFSLVDSPDLAGWQSGVYYADRTPKPSLAAVKAAAIAVRRNAIARCSWLHVTPRPLINFFPAGAPTSRSGRLPIVLTCDVDCAFRLRLERLPAHSTTLEAHGSARGGIGLRVLLPRARLAPSRYRFTLTATATSNQGPAASLASAPFEIRPPGAPSPPATPPALRRALALVRTR